MLATQGICAQLPDDLLFGCVLWRLPSQDLIRCRAVCRLWNKRIGSPSFQVHLRPPPEEPWLLIFDRCIGECCAYSPRSVRWNKLCIGGPPDWCNPSPIAAGGGLLIYILEVAYHNISENYNTPALRLAVCNPFTRAWKELPPMTHKYCAKPFVGVINLHGSAHFNVVVAGGLDVYHRCHCSTEVYDSSTDSWSVDAQMLPEKDALGITESWCPQSGVVCQDGMLYCITTTASGMGYEVSSMMAYDLESRTWRKDHVYDVERGVWDRLKWRMEGVSHSLSLMKSGSSPRGLMLVGGHIGCPAYLWPLAYEAASGLLRWTEEMPEPVLASLQVDQQGLASACSLYFFNTCSDFEVVKWDYTSSSSPAWTSLPTSPLPPHHLDRRAIAFLVEPSLHINIHS